MVLEIYVQFRVGSIALGSWGDSTSHKVELEGKMNR